MEGVGADRDSVVGDECHIVGRGARGPRSGEIAPALTDNYDNLIVLCKTDHKRVDDQSQFFTSGVLRAMKIDHEAWVEGRLRFPDVVPGQAPLAFSPPKFFRAPREQELTLNRIESGQELLNLLAVSCQSITSHDDAADECEAELIADFLEEVFGWAEVGEDMTHGDHVRASFTLTERIRHLEANKYLVFAGRVPRTVEINGRRHPWSVTSIRVVRMTNPKSWNSETLAGLGNSVQEQEEAGSKVSGSS